MRHLTHVSFIGVLASAVFMASQALAGIKAGVIPEPAAQLADDHHIIETYLGVRKH